MFPKCRPQIAILEKMMRLTLVEFRSSTTTSAFPDTQSINQKIHQRIQERSQNFVRLYIVSVRRSIQKHKLPIKHHIPQRYKFIVQTIVTTKENQGKSLEKSLAKSSNFLIFVQIWRWGLDFFSVKQLMVMSILRLKLKIVLLIFYCA